MSSYTIDADTGAINYINDIPAGQGPRAVTVTPNGKFLYVTNNAGDSVSHYTINPTTGRLTYSSMSPTGSSPVSVAVDPTGKFLYVANWGSGAGQFTVSAYTIDATTGALTSAGLV